LAADAEALVNTVNCVGVMGRGIALQFKKAFPENFRFYEAACKKHEVRIGRVLVFETGLLTRPKYIINFPTKRHWRGPSRNDYIDAGLKSLIGVVRSRGIRSIAIPPLGCGLGGLDWDDVRSRITKAFAELPDVKVLLFEPAGAPRPEKMAKASKAPRMTPGRAVLVELIDRYLGAVLDPFVSLLELHKLMYFMQETGEPLNLRFEKGTYGPYAKSLRHVLSLMEGHLISGYGDADDKPSRPIELLPGAAESAAAFIASHPETQDRFERVSKLIHGFETPYGMELLATVHWVAAREGARSFEEAVLKIYAWNPPRGASWSASSSFRWRSSSAGWPACAALWAQPPTSGSWWTRAPQATCSAPCRASVISWRRHSLRACWS
jgi:O-acetyl-ADP-ribose deacetylase (regulator of RNase III)